MQKSSYSVLPPTDLVNDVDKGSQLLRFRAIGLGRRVPNDLHGLVREDDGAVAVGLEVHSDVKVESGVVKVLYASRNAGDRDVLLTWKIEYMIL